MSRCFPFRPWVRRAGLSIVLVAVGATVLVAVTLNERALWLYLGTLWIGGLKVWLGTMRPVAELDDDAIVLRPLHQLRATRIAWPQLCGTEQMTGGDRMIVYHDTPRGMRFVALNLNLIKGRREFVTMIDQRLRAMGFEEKTVERSRYLTRRE
jgi:hypothetical protein